MLPQHIPQSRWNQQIICRERSTAKKKPCIRAILKLLLIVQLCLQYSVLLITAHAHYYNWHKHNTFCINDGDKHKPQQAETMFKNLYCVTKSVCVRASLCICVCVWGGVYVLNMQKWIKSSHLLPAALSSTRKLQDFSFWMSVVQIWVIFSSLYLLSGLRLFGCSDWTQQLINSKCDKFNRERMTDRLDFALD